MICTWIRRQRLPFAKKKNKRQSTRPFTTGLFMLRCKELGLSVIELENMDFGLVADMLVEKENDEYSWPYKATQKDFDKF